MFDDLDLGLAWVDQPDPAEVFVGTIAEEAEEHRVDGGTIFIGQVGDDAFGAVVQLAGHHYQFVAFVESPRAFP